MSSPALRWTLAIVAILGGALVANGILLYFALSDRSFAVEPDYYRRAVAHDASAASARRALALGWEIALEPPAGGSGETLVSLTDGRGLALEGARVEVSAFHNARAGVVEVREAVARGGGRYAALLALGRGLWVFRVSVARGGERSSFELRREIPEVARR